jgi:GDP-mannose 6-dehydrogenase
MHAGILASNRVHLEHAIAKVLATGKRRIGLVGLAFKAGTDDLRESPMVYLAEHLIGKGLSLLVYDPEVHLSSLIGANRRFIETHVPHIGALIRHDLGEVTAQSEVLVVGQNSPATLSALSALVTPEQVVIDLAGIQRQDVNGKYVGLSW